MDYIRCVNLCLHTLFVSFLILTPAFEGTTIPLTILGIATSDSQAEIEELQNVVEGALIDFKTHTSATSTTRSSDNFNNRSDINGDTLPGYDIRFSWIISDCNADRVARKVIASVSDPPIKLAIFGTACLEATLAYQRFVPYFNLVQMETRSPSALLSNAGTQLVTRIIGSDILHNNGRIQVLKLFDWHMISIIYQDTDEHFKIAKDLQEKTLENSINTTLMKSFLKGSSQDVITELSAADSRIIVYEGSIELAVELFCQAYKNGFYGSRYVWLLRASIVSGLQAFLGSDSSCDTGRILQVVDGSILTSINDQNIVTRKGAMREFPEHLVGKQSTAIGSTLNFDAVYDGVWAIAFALTEAALRANMTTGGPEVADVVYQSLMDVKFNGKTGYVEFNGKGEREMPVTILQYQEKELVEVSVYSHITDTLIQIEGKTFQWHGNQTPVDGRGITEKQVDLYFPLVLTFDALTASCFLFTCIFLYVTLCLWRPILKNSYNGLDFISIVGCILAYVAVALYSLDGGLLDSFYIALLCQIRPWVISLAFTLGYGSMCVKTVYMYRSLSTIEMFKVNRSDMYQACSVAGIVMVDLVILMTRQFYDPPEVGEVRFATEFRPDEVIHFKRTTCFTEWNYWISALYVYKGAQIMTACVVSCKSKITSAKMMYEIRSMRLMTCANGVISIIGAILVILLDVHNPNIEFAIIASCTLVGACFISTSHYALKVFELTKVRRKLKRRHIQRSGARIQRNRSSRRDSFSSAAMSSKVNQRWVPDSTTFLSKNSIYLGVVKDKDSLSNVYTTVEGSIIVHTRASVSEDEVSELKLEISQLKEAIEKYRARKKPKKDADESASVVDQEVGRDLNPSTADESSATDDKRSVSGDTVNEPKTTIVRLCTSL
ncbi:gamma-aminobutyric acid type B receptor subunit 2-like [Ptychodera flava]|uniref:gamma-aminobutyric acid type B receptor subunit 2-like n=1 Tax=Ptychodera flava TaxID=63121 RepID=UPI00396AAAF3